MEKAIKFKESCPINRSLTGEKYDISEDVALDRDRVILVNDDVLKTIKDNMLDSLTIIGDCGRKYITLSTKSKNFKNNMFNIDLDSIENIDKLLSFSKEICGFALCEVSLLSLYYGDTEVKLTFFNPDYTRVSKVIVHLDERCKIYEVVAEDILGPISGIVSDIEIKKEELEGYLKCLIRSVENVSFPVEFLEVGLWSNMSEDPTLDSQQSFSNKESTVSGVSLISEFNNFREMGYHYGTYAICIIM